MRKPDIIDVPDFRLPQGFKVAPILIGLLVLAAVNGLWYKVPPESEAIRLRFGRIVEEGIKPGLHFKLPFNIETVDIEPVQRQLKLEFGAETYQEGATNPWQYGDASDPALVRNMVTGDLNAADIAWVVQYRIQDMKSYLYGSRFPVETLRDAAESVMREIVGDRTVDEVLTVGRQEVEAESKARLATLAKLYNLGVAIDQVQLKGVNPPRSVARAFEDVNKAQQERESSINEARAQYNSMVPLEKGKADQLVSESEGTALKRVNEATGDANRFKAVFTEYQKAPDVTRRRLYNETMIEVLPKMGKKVILDDAAKNVLPFLPLQTTGGR
jgi:modulator of FtsH protease HflK